MTPPRDANSSPSTVPDVGNCEKEQKLHQLNEEVTRLQGLLKDSEKKTLHIGEAISTQILSDFTCKQQESDQTM